MGRGGLHAGGAPPTARGWSSIPRWSGASPGEHFGGFSGLEVLDGGSEVLAISDRGRWARGTMHRADGRLTAVEGADRRQRGRLQRDLRRAARGSDTSTPRASRSTPKGAPTSPSKASTAIRRYDDIDGPAAGCPSTRISRSSRRTPASRRWRSTPRARSTPSPSAPASSTGRSRSTACATGAGTRT